MKAVVVREFGPPESIRVEEFPPPRPGENDGGYAVMDYRAVDPRLGTMEDLEAAAQALRERGMSLCVDLVINHTAREHPWARGWVAGDPAYADFYLAFPDRARPDAYEATIADVWRGRITGVQQLGIDLRVDLSPETI